MAAGNAVVIKPSEVTAHCMALLAKIVPQYLHQQAFPVRVCPSLSLPVLLACCLPLLELRFSVLHRGCLPAVVLRSSAQNDPFVLGFTRAAAGGLLSAYVGAAV